MGQVGHGDGSSRAWGWVKYGMGMGQVGHGDESSRAWGWVK